MVSETVADERDTIRAPKLAELVADRLRSAITSGELPQGHRMAPEHDLVTRFAVSRATMREALRLLESDGLVTVRRGPHGGAVVTDRTADTVKRAFHTNLLASRTTMREVHEALREIEPAAARMAAERHARKASKALFAQIAYHRSIIDDVERYAVGLQDFRRVMMRNCGNQPLIIMTSALYAVMIDQMPPLARLWMERGRDNDLTHEPRVRAIDWHQGLAQTIASGNGVKAEAEWRRFAKRMGERFFSTVDGDQPVR